MKKRRSIILFIFLFTLTAVTLYCQFSHFISSAQTNDTIILLISDSFKEYDPEVKIWLDAGNEEGLHIKVMQDNEFLRPCTNRASFAGVILPDQVHKNASNILIDTLTHYVKDGGHLMLVYDAGMLKPNGSYAKPVSRFSRLAGVNYGLYGTLHEKMTVWESVQGTDSVFTAMHVPPGKYVKLQTNTNHITTEQVYALSGYQAPQLNYPLYATENDYDGQILLQTQNNLAAGYRRQGKGGVLFINIPLGYLKGRTDGILLHGFLRYFADNILYLPYLATVPDATGGLVMNWHMDSNVSLQPLKELKQLGFYEQGPYSIHVSAGPDSKKAGDQLGLDVENNKETKNWIEFFKQRGYAIGSHGGWMHDYFGNNVTDNNREKFEPLLLRNKQALDNILNTSVQEYSAPEGNHPQWVNGWLQKQDFLAYYFTGNTGMGPTRSYRDGKLKHPGLWSFPVLTYRRMASFDEFKQQKVSNDEVAQWLKEITKFSVQKKVARLIYFHPRGANKYPQAMRSWLASTAKLGKAEHFRWYTMTELSRFLQARKQVSWTVTEEDNKQLFTATHPSSLSQQTWVLAKMAYNKPNITSGKGTVVDVGEQWLIRADEGATLQFTTEQRAQ